MEENQVKLILNLREFPPAEVLEEILEEEIFHIRDYFLRNPIVPVLFKSRIRKLAQLAEIEEKYLDTQQPSEFTPLDLKGFESITIKDELRNLEAQLAEIRKEMSKTLNTKFLSGLALQMISVQSAFEVNFVELFEKEYDQRAINSYPVKAAEQLDSGLTLGLYSNSETEKIYPLLENEYNRIQKVK